LLLVALVAGVKYLPEIQAEILAFQDARRGVDTGDFARALLTSPDAEGEGAWERVRGLAGQYWDMRRDRAYRVMFVLGLAWLTGLGMGLTLPRFTMILGTSVVGVLCLAVGLGLVISRYWQGLWSVLVKHAPLSLAGLGVVLILSLLYQMRRGRLVAVSPRPLETPPPVSAAAA